MRSSAPDLASVSLARPMRRGFSNLRRSRTCGRWSCVPLGPASLSSVPWSRRSWTCAELRHG